MNRIILNLGGYSIVRAAVVAGFAALVLATHTFVDADRLRLKLVDASPVVATSGLASATVAGDSQINALRPPFALIARIRNQSAVARSFSIAVDGVYVCERPVAGGAEQRVDCAVTSAWSSTAEHHVTVQGPSTPWTLEFLELATHHGHTTGVHTLLVLPSSSGHYTRPSPVWVVVTWLVLTAVMLVLPPARFGRRGRMLYGVGAGLILLELTLSMFSQWISDYRIVLSAHTFAIWMLVLLTPRLWVPIRDAARRVAPDVSLGAPGSYARRVAVRACVIGALGITLRAILSSVSIGTNDITTWQMFAHYANWDGVLWMYENLAGWNHPPLTGYLAGGLLRLSEVTGLRFPVAFKLAPIAADGLCLVLLWKIWRRRSEQPVAALAAVAIFSFSPDAILVSAYHGNTDPLVGLFVLAACYFVEAEGRYFWAGVALAAAVNVKLIPLMLAPLFLANVRRWPEAIRFVAGLSLGAIPFLPVILRVGQAFYRNAIAYNSNFDHWGIPLFILRAEGNPEWAARAVQLRAWFVPAGRYLVIATILALCAWSRWRRPLSTYQLAAGGLAAFLVLASGFGVQYTAILGPVLVAASLGWGAWYAVSAGAFIGSVYYMFGTPTELPLLSSRFYGPFPYPSPWIGLVVWAGLVAFLISLPRGRVAR